MHQLSGPIDHTVMHVRRVLGIVEEHALAGLFIHLGMRGDPIERPPRRLAQSLKRQRIDHPRFAALVKRRVGDAGMHKNVG